MQFRDGCQRNFRTFDMGPIDAVHATLGHVMRLSNPSDMNAPEQQLPCHSKSTSWT